MQNPLITAIITTYKRGEPFFKRALTSVINQTYQPMEILIVDDNEKNSGYKLTVQKTVKDFPPKYNIRLISHDDNKGAQKARNTGLMNANGKYIAFLDDDDEWLPDKIMLQYKIFRESNDGQLGIVYCGSATITVNCDNILLVKTDMPSVDKAEIKTLLPKKNIIGSTSFPLIKKECFDKVGYFDEELPAKQDYDMWLRISKYFTIDYVPEVLCNYYAHMDERITSNMENKIKAEKMFLKKHIDVIRNDKIALSFKNNLISEYYMELGQFMIARNHLRKSIFVYPFEYRTYALYILTILRIRPKRARNVKHKLLTAMQISKNHMHL